jgi:hypothetical protein
MRITKRQLKQIIREAIDRTSMVDFSTMSPQELSHYDLGYEHGLEAEDALQDQPRFYYAGYDDGVADRSAGHHMVDPAPPTDRSRYKSPETKNPFYYD